MVRSHLRRFFAVPGKLMDKRIDPGPARSLFLRRAHAGEPLLHGYAHDRFGTLTSSPREILD
jgi:hypothetical protein